MATQSQTEVNVGMAVAAAGAFAPLAGPWGVLADQVLVAGLQYWTDYAAKKASGSLTVTDVQDAASMANDDVSKFDSDIAAALQSHPQG